MPLPRDLYGRHDLVRKYISSGVRYCPLTLLPLSLAFKVDSASPGGNSIGRLAVGITSTFCEGSPSEVEGVGRALSTPRLSGRTRTGDAPASVFPGCAVSFFGLIDIPDFASLPLWEEITQRRSPCHCHGGTQSAKTKLSGSCIQITFCNPRSPTPRTSG